VLYGYFHRATGRPYLRALVRIAADGASEIVQFLVDTGSGTSLLNPWDTRRLRIDHSAWGKDPR
jgi:hypothetical protein